MIRLRSSGLNRTGWEEVGTKDRRSWYLDPLVAKQKREAHGELLLPWPEELRAGLILKTDLFEEAFGDDAVLGDLACAAGHVVGMDIAASTVARARARFDGSGFSFLVADARALGLRQDSFDVVLSNSTLDHFETASELRASLGELARVVKPGGVLIVTLDNPSNPLYRVLRWTARRGWAPFALGCTMRGAELNASLRDCGFEVVANEWLIHNPRLLSTGLFLLLRRVLGARADLPVRALLSMFGVLGRACRRGDSPRVLWRPRGESPQHDVTRSRSTAHHPGPRLFHGAWRTSPQKSSLDISATVPTISMPGWTPISAKIRDVRFSVESTGFTSWTSFRNASS